MDAGITSCFFSGLLRAQSESENKVQNTSHNLEILMCKFLTWIMPLSKTTFKLSEEFRDFFLSSSYCDSTRIETANARVCFALVALIISIVKVFC
jgi:hypothetical protein